VSVAEAEAPLLLHILRRDHGDHCTNAERQKCVNVCELELERWNADFASLLCSSPTAFSYIIYRRLRPWNGANWKQLVRPVCRSFVFAWDLSGEFAGEGTKLATCVWSSEYRCMQQSGKIPAPSFKLQAPNSRLQQRDPPL